jgi:hypothetical protein
VYILDKSQNVIISSTSGRLVPDFGITATYQENRSLTVAARFRAFRAATVRERLLGNTLANL